jgi:hypothetical protein
VSLDPAKALGHLPEGLRGELVAEYQKIMRNFRESRWEGTELDGGRFSEIVYSILLGHLDGDKYPAKAKKPDRFMDACIKLGSRPATFSDSARMMIPRVLIGLYDVRNRRGVGHVGGEVSSNHMDATLVAGNVRWVMAELVRMFHDTDIATAQATVDALVDRTLPVIWEVDGVTRVLDHKLALKDKILLLLYASPQGLSEKSLMASLGLTKIYNLKRVLKPLHDEVMVHYREADGWMTLSPKGGEDAELRLLKTAI